MVTRTTTTRRTVTVFVAFAGNRYIDRFFGSNTKERDKKQIVFFMENLPIYRKLYILICLLYRYIKQAPKEYKYSLGESLIEHAWQCMDHFFEAYYSSGRDRLQKINAMILVFDRMKIRIRMAREIGILKPKSLNHIEVLTLAPLGLMMGGWKRKIEKSL